MASPKTSNRKRFDAADHEEAYDLWARHFSDPNLMTNRDATATRKKLSRLAGRLPLSETARVLDVGPGDGTLFALIADQVALCVGVDPSTAALEKLRDLHTNTPNTVFTEGRSTHIPYDDGFFDVVVINSVLQMLNSEDVMIASMEELARVTGPDGVIFVGELPFRSELGQGVLRHLGRKCYEYGVWGLLRLLFTIYIKPLLKGEPMVTYPTSNLHFPQQSFEALAVRLGFEVQCWRHQEVQRASLTRNDYLLSRRKAE